MYWSKQTPSSNNTGEDSIHGHHQMVNPNQIDYILCSQRWRSSTQSAKTRPGADCGSDHELLIAKFRLKLKKVGKTTRPFRYDLNRIPNQSTLKEINPMCSLEGLMLKLKLQYFGHLMRRIDPLEKTLMLGGIGGRRRRE